MNCLTGKTGLEQGGSIYTGSHEGNTLFRLLPQDQKIEDLYNDVETLKIKNRDLTNQIGFLKKEIIEIRNSVLVNK